MLTLLKAGILTTVQDNGRFLGAHLGIPSSGSMDRMSANLANLMLSNDINDALLECTFVGPTIKFDDPTIIAITGATATVFKNEIEIDASFPIQIQKGDLISFGRFENGCRLYISIKDGIQSDMIYGSRSTCYTAGILEPLKKGDQLKYIPSTYYPKTTVSIYRPSVNTELFTEIGPEFSILRDIQKERLFKNKFTILPSSNRMAYRVSHTVDLTHTYSMLSSGTLPGSIQLTPSGELICLMRDCQTTGGYPRILQLVEKSICNLSQLIPGNSFTLTLTK